MPEPLTVIVGCPSGGTSAVAGLLVGMGFHLGQTVDDRQRPYPIHECQQCWVDVVQPAWPGGSALPQENAGAKMAQRFTAYAQRRMVDGGWSMQAVKNPGLVLAIPYLKSMRAPIRVVAVQRPLDAVMQSDAKTKRRPGRQRVLAMLYETLRSVIDDGLADHVVGYDDLRRHPEAHVQALAHRLGVPVDQPVVEVLARQITQYRRAG